MTPSVLSQALSAASQRINRSLLDEAQAACTAGRLNVALGEAFLKAADEAAGHATEGLPATFDRACGPGVVDAVTDQPCAKVREGGALPVSPGSLCDRASAKAPGVFSASDIRLHVHDSNLSREP